MYAVSYVRIMSEEGSPMCQGLLKAEQVSKESKSQEINLGNEKLRVELRKESSSEATHATPIRRVLSSRGLFEVFFLDGTSISSLRPFLHFRCFAFIWRLQ